MAWKKGMNFIGYLPDGDYLKQTVSRQVILVMLLLCYHLWFIFISLLVIFSCNYSLKYFYILLQNRQLYNNK